MSRLVECVVVTIATLATFDPALAEVRCDDTDTINCSYDPNSGNGWIVNESRTEDTRPSTSGADGSYSGAPCTDSGPTGF